MKMEIRCPFCRSYNISQSNPDYEWATEDDCIVTWDAKCGHCEREFIISEVVVIKSRLVAKDVDHLSELEDKEHEEDKTHE